MEKLELKRTWLPFGIGMILSYEVARKMYFCEEFAVLHEAFSLADEVICRTDLRCTVSVAVMSPVTLLTDINLSGMTLTSDFVELC